MRALAPLALALLLTGCAATTAPATEQPDDDCLELSNGALNALQDGLDDKGAGYTINHAAAIADGDSWWVAADLDGHPPVQAVWMTVNDPTADGDNAYISATELASLVSIYLMPEDLSGADPVEAAKDCLP